MVVSSSLVDARRFSVVSVATEAKWELRRTIRRSMSEAAYCTSDVVSRLGADYLNRVRVSTPDLALSCFEIAHCSSRRTELGAPCSPRLSLLRATPTTARNVPRLPPTTSHPGPESHISREQGQRDTGDVDAHCVGPYRLGSSSSFLPATLRAHFEGIVEPVSPPHPRFFGGSSARRTPFAGKLRRARRLPTVVSK